MKNLAHKNISRPWGSSILRRTCVIEKDKKDGCCVFTVTITKPKKKPFHSRLAISVNPPVGLESSEWFNICESKCARHLKVSSACKAGANVQAKKHQFFANLTCALFIWIAWGFTSLRAVLWLSIWRLETDRIQQHAQKGNDTNDEHHFRSIGWGTMTLELFLTPNAQGRIRRFWLLTVEVQTGRVFFSVQGSFCQIEQELSLATKFAPRSNCVCRPASGKWQDVEIRRILEDMLTILRYTVRCMQWFTMSIVSLQRLLGDPITIVHQASWNGDQRGVVHGSCVACNE